MWVLLRGVSGGYIQKKKIRDCRMERRHVEKLAYFQSAM
jgi:hypothetical protein